MYGRFGGFLCVWLLGTVFAPVAATFGDENPESAAEVSNVSNLLSLGTFDVVWETINRSYYDPEFGGLDWKALGEKYRPSAAQAEDADQLRPILQKMLSELGMSHFAILPGESELQEAIQAEPQKPDGADVAPDAKSKAKSDAENRPESGGDDADETNEGRGEEPDDEDENAATPGTYSGLHLRLDGENLVIGRVDAGSPGDNAGMKAGMTVRKIGPIDVSEAIGRTTGLTELELTENYLTVKVLEDLMAAKNKQTLTVESKPGRAREITFEHSAYPGQTSPPLMNLPGLPVMTEVNRIPRPAGDVIYLQFNIFLPLVMPEIRKAVSQAREGGTGLIIDLRGNPGGIGAMANGIAGLLSDEELTLGTMHMRGGHMAFTGFPQKDAFLGPVAILIDRHSGSTSEILAGGLQEVGRARVFGRRSMGAALPSMIVNLPNGDRLQHAIADFQTPAGKAIEGRGVIPDVQVPINRKKWLQGKDPTRMKALKWIDRQARKARDELRRTKAEGGGAVEDTAKSGCG